MTNQNPEQIARDEIDKMLEAAGWVVQSKKKVDLSVAKGVAVREYQTDIGPADYVLFVSRKPVGVIEAKRVEEGEKLTTHEDQSKYYSRAKLKYNLNKEPLPFVYESTGILTRFTDYRDPKPRSRPVFHFHKPETLMEWFDQAETLRSRLKNIPPLMEKLKFEKPLLAPHHVWEAYAQLEDVKGNSLKNYLVALVSLVRRVTGIDRQLTPYDNTVDKNFKIGCLVNRLAR